MSLCFVDIETRSRVDLKKSNVYRYAADPDFKILMLAYAVGNGPVKVATNLVEIEHLIRSWATQGHTIVAHNAAFERVCFSEHLRRYADPSNPVLRAHEYLDPALFDDSMVIAAEWGYPMRLVELGQWLGGEKKLDAGVHMIRYFCVPNRKGDFNGPDTDPEKWAQFVDYNVQDVVTLRDVYTRLPAWPTQAERDAWIVDQRINDRGIAVDVPLATAAVDASETNRMIQEIEFSTVTGVANPGSTQQLLAWFHETGLPLPNLQAATVAATLARDDIAATHRRALELRRELALVASKKYTAALDRVSKDGRLRGSFQFFGAHTGRWAGRGVQLQNLPAATIKPQGDETVDEAIAAEALDVTMGMGGDSETLKALVRSMFTGPFTVVDYSAIEARVLAWLAGEQWALDAFAAGRDIYVETAKRMGNLTRKEGKVATLALGYNGGVGSLQAMGALGSNDYLQSLVTQWREANTNITQLWRDLEQAFWSGGRVGTHLRVETLESELTFSRKIVLPSGRAITYHACQRKWQDNKWGKRSPQLSFRDPKRGGARVETYGGRLTENVTQAVARDVLTDALVALEAEGLLPVGHVHDEILVEGTYPVDYVADIMTTVSPWAVGLPLAAEGYHCPRYRKD